MTTPDAAASAPISNTIPAAELGADHRGAVVTADGVTGTLTEVAGGPGRVSLIVHQDGRPFGSTIVLEPGDTVQLAEPPAPEIVPIDTDKVRELAYVQDQIKARKGEMDDLKDREKELQGELLTAFELNGSDSIRVDGRACYIRTDTYPKYLDRDSEDGGGKYTAKDAVEVLRAIGREAQIQPETVNYQTLGAILREYRDNEEPLPEALAKIVELGEEPKVRVGAPTRKRR